MDPFDGYESYDATGLATLVRQKEVTPLQLLEAAISRLEKINPTINAVVVKWFDRAREEAARVLSNGLFRGVPFLVKDLELHISGTPMTNGSSFLSDFVCQQDSELYLRFKKCGLVTFGRTNSPEFGFNVSTEPSLYGPCRNPWNLRRIAGGSSGGAAAAVATGIVPMAHASDGAGSIRGPASCCGLVGLKPTRGRNPIGANAGEGSAGRLQEHVICRSIRDCAATLDAISGPTVGAPYFATPNPLPYREEIMADCEPLRMAVSVDVGGITQIHSQCKQAVHAAAKLCRSLGHDVEDAFPEYDFTELESTHRVIIPVHIAAAVNRYSRLLGMKPNAGKFESVIWQAFKRGTSTSATDYLNKVQSMHRIAKDIAKFFEAYDILIIPTVSKPPVKLGTLNMNGTEFDEFADRCLDFNPVNLAFNATGQPAISLPLYWTSNNLPIGVEFVGRYGCEATLLRLSSQLEKAQPWFHRRPPQIIEV